MKPPDACRFICNKAYYFAPPPLIDGKPAKEPGPLSTPCWCIHTHEPIGPDGDAVEPDMCIAGRGCYEPEVKL